MPDQQPAPTENTPVEPRDADNGVNALMGDAGMGPGGGGLGPRSAANPDEGKGAPLGTAPNAPIDVPTPNAGRAGDGATGSPPAEKQAAVESFGAPPPDKA